MNLLSSASVLLSLLSVLSPFSPDVRGSRMRGSGLSGSGVCGFGLPGLLAIALLLAGCSGPPETPPPDRVIEDQGGVSNALNDYLRENSVAQDNSFELRYVDLNNDKVDDALVLMQGFDWCSVSGCTMLVFRGLPAAGYFEFVSAIDQVRAPIVVSDERTDGWNNLVVASRIKGRPADVSIAFEGQAYPSDPSGGKVIGGLTAVAGQQMF